MPKLTRRCSADSHRKTWHVCYDEIRVGTIGEHAGVPVHGDQWGWSCGFYPGLEPRQHRYGTAATFEAARAGFEADWRALLSDMRSRKAPSTNTAATARFTPGKQPCGRRVCYCRRK